MDKHKNVVTLIAGIVLLLIMATASFGYAEEVIPSFREENHLGKAEIEKVNRENTEKDSKTIIKESKDNNKKIILKDEAEKIGKSIFKEYCKIDINKTTPIKTSDLMDNNYEITLGSDLGKSKIKLNKYGDIINIYVPIKKDTMSKTYNIDVDKNREFLENFFKEYYKDNYKNLKVTLTNKKPLGGNISEYKLQRVHNDIDVVEEGGSVYINNEDIKIIQFDMKWSSIDFEEEKGKTLNKQEAFDILKESRVIEPIYVNNNNKYSVDFLLNEDKEYTIDVGKRDVKDFLKTEYIVKNNISKSIDNLNNKAKTKEEIEQISLDIISKIVNKKGRTLPIKEVEENSKSLIRNVVVTEDKERYYIEYDSKTFKVVNIYKYGYSTKETKNFKPIEFEKAYEKAVKSIGALYSEEFNNLNLKQKEYSLMNSRVYNFNFNREENDIKVEDQYIAVSIDAITGEILSIFLEWNNESQFDKASKHKIDREMDKYLNKLKGKYKYINENGIGKLYYTLKKEEK